MSEIFTVANMFNGLLLLLGWSIRNELSHIKESVVDAKSTANAAHARIDTALCK